MRLPILGAAAIAGLLATCGEPPGYGQDVRVDLRPNTTAANGVITDVTTGLQFHKVHTLVGAGDIIDFTHEVRLSPNGKFLLWLMKVIPLEGGTPWNLVDFPAARGVWSPDGRKIAFYSGGIWVIPVSPETGKATGPAKKVVEGYYWFQRGVTWSPDSEKILFIKDIQDANLWTYSVETGQLVQLTDERTPRTLGAWAANGKAVVYCREGRELRVLDTATGVSRKIVDTEGRVNPDCSPDGKWICYQAGKRLRLVRIADARRVDVDLPGKVGDYIGWSPDSERVFFYRPSYGYRELLKVVSVSGGRSFAPAKELQFSGFQYWSTDSKYIVTWKWRDDRWQYLVVPVVGNGPFPLEVEAPTKGQVQCLSLSPDATKLLLSVGTAAENKKHWIVPVSIPGGKTGGDPVEVDVGSAAERITWSSDLSRLLVQQSDTLWLVRTDGGRAAKLTSQNGGRISQPQLSRDGSIVAWVRSRSEKTVLYVKRSSEVEPRKIVESSRAMRYSLSPDGTRIAYRTYEESEGVVNSALSVIATSGGSPRKLVESKEFFKSAWSHDGKQLAVMANGKISAFGFPEGTVREIASLDDTSFGGYYRIDWSPDGKTLAFILAHEPGDLDPSSPSSSSDDLTRIFTVPSAGGDLTELAADDRGGKNFLAWSPDGKWLSFDSGQSVKIRPAGLMWEAEIGEHLERTTELR